MEQIILKAKPREETGKQNNKKLRSDGLIPAVVYKKGEKSQSLKLVERDFENIMHHAKSANVIFNLKIGDGNKSEMTVIIKDIQTHPVSKALIHVDFNEISLTQAIIVKVPIHTKGEAIGVKRDGGILAHLLWELEIECLPTQIPDKIEIDVTNLELGKAIHVKDLTIANGIKVLSAPDVIVASVEAPKDEKVAEAIPGEEAAKEPEVIKEKKPEEAVAGETAQEEKKK